MGVDFFNCSICDEIHSDCESYGYCGKCKDVFCEECLEEQQKKYGVKAKEENRKSKECDNCSETTKADRIAKKEKELRDLKKS